jgi:hypothetical protein
MSGGRWITGILGLWVALAGIIGFTPSFTLWDNLIAGIVIAIFGFSLVRGSALRGWVTGILGLWVIVAGFIPALEQGAALFWDNLLVGLVIAIAAWIPAGPATPHPVPHAQA